MRVIVIGGYGSFGRRITSRILKIPGIKVIICGRNAFKAKELFPSCQYSKLDIFEPNLEMKIKELKGDLLIHTAGPFDECEGYRVAKACIAASCNYIDLSDNRQYVNGMHHLLDSSAKAAGCTVISGASTTPGLTSSVIHSFALHNQLSSVDIRISAANSSMPGEATVKSILSYCGKPIKIVVNKKDVYITAWQYPSLSTIPGLSERRLCSDVDIPDSDSDYTRDLENFRFRAGVENRFSMLGLAALALARRFNFISSQLLCNQSKFLLELIKALRNRWIKSESSTDGGMVVTMQGRAQHDNNITATVTWGIVASESAGPEIPCTPAVILTRKFAEIHATKTHKHASLSPGASACTGHFNLKEFMEELTEDEWTREHVNEYVQYQYCRTGKRECVVMCVFMSACMSVCTRVCVCMCGGCCRSGFWLSVIEMRRYKQTNCFFVLLSLYSFFYVCIVYMCTIQVTVCIPALYRGLNRHKISRVSHLTKHHHADSVTQFL